MDREALIELAKSFGRAVWFGVLGIVSAFLVSLATNTELATTMWTAPVIEVALPIGAWIILGAGFVAKAIDRYVHKSTNTKSNGIAPNFLQG